MIGGDDYMIAGELYTKIEFDGEGERKIKAAYSTLEEINDAFSKVGCFTSTEQDILSSAIDILKRILNRECF